MRGTTWETPVATTRVATVKELLGVIAVLEHHLRRMAATPSALETSGNVGIVLARLCDVVDTATYGMWVVALHGNRSGLASLSGIASNIDSTPSGVRKHLLRDAARGLRRPPRFMQWRDYDCVGDSALSRYEALCIVNDVEPWPCPLPAPPADLSEDEIKDIEVWEKQRRRTFEHIRDRMRRRRKSEPHRGTATELLIESLKGQPVEVDELSLEHQQRIAMVDELAIRLRDAEQELAVLRKRVEGSSDEDAS